MGYFLTSSGSLLRKCGIPGIGKDFCVDCGIGIAEWFSRSESMEFASRGGMKKWREEANNGMT
jgi:hypothetical protein